MKKRTGLDRFAMEINDLLTMDAVKKHLDAAGVTIDAIPGGFAAMDPGAPLPVSPLHLKCRVHVSRLN